jgi:hypothetical protein
MQSILSCFHDPPITFRNSASGLIFSKSKESMIPVELILAEEFINSLCEYSSRAARLLPRVTPSGDQNEVDRRIFRSAA